MIYRNIEQMNLEYEDKNYSIKLNGNIIKNKIDLFREIALKLHFPEFFGNNWDALDDCLCDLEWINSTKIQIVFENFSKILSDESCEQKNILLDCIKDSNDYWEKNKTKNVNFYIID